MPESLSPEEFLHAFERSPAQWDAVGKSLWQAAAILERRIQTACARIEREAVSHTANRSRRQRESLQRAIRMQELGRVSSMLRAMSIEAILKMGFYQKQVKQKGTVFVKDRAPGDHKLLQLANIVKLKPSKEQQEFLLRHELMIEMGRYPISHKNKNLSWQTDP